MDLATLEQLLGNDEGGLACQRAALDQHRLYRSPCAGRAALRLLALAAPGDIGANTPLEFLLEGSDVALDTLYVVPGAAVPAVAAAHRHRHRRRRRIRREPPGARRRSQRLTADWRVPVLNDPARVAQLSRERGRRADAGRARASLAPVDAAALGRAALAAGGGRRISAHRAARSIPMPAAASRGSPTGRARRLSRARGRRATFFVSPFVDYRSADGLFRKYRIAFIDGEPYACHMAIADQWMIYYLNAGMRESAAKRAEEARFMRDFDVDFARRHEAALADIAERDRARLFRDRLRRAPRRAALCCSRPTSP